MVDADDEIAVDAGRAKLLEVAVVPHRIGALAADARDEVMDASRVRADPLVVVVVPVEYGIHVVLVEQRDPVLVHPCCRSVLAARVGGVMEEHELPTRIDMEREVVLQKLVIRLPWDVAAGSIAFQDREM